jgi:hypothetical protein
LIGYILNFLNLPTVMDNKPYHFHHENFFCFVEKNRDVCHQEQYKLTYFPSRLYRTLSRFDRALRFFPKNSSSHGIGFVALERSKLEKNMSTYHQSYLTQCVWMIYLNH